MDDNLLFSDKAKDAKGGKAKRIFQVLKDMRNDADITQDPFRKKFGDKLVDELIKSKEFFAMFLHWAYRDHKKALPIEHWEMHGKQTDNFTSGYQGLDLTDDEIFDWLVSNYGEDEAIERLETKLESARQLLYEVFSESLSNKAWGELVESKRLAKSDFNKAEDKDPVFIQPNKPMYRIFEIDDMKELKGFTGEWVVQEKYDGLRIQMQKIDKKIKVYSFDGKDITSKCKEQVQELIKISLKPV